MTRKLSGGVTGALGIGSLSLSSTTIIPGTANTNLELEGTGTGKVATANQLVVTNPTQSTNVNTGALKVSGGVAVPGDLYVGGGFGGSGINNNPIGASTPSTGAFTSLTASGLTTIAEATEVVGTKTGASGVVVHSFTEANTWNHVSITNNFTVNVTNVPITNDRAITIKLILNQSNPAYYANALQIDGVAQTINWEGGGLPVPINNAIDTQVFTLVRSGSTWTVSSTLDSSSATYHRLGLRWYYDAGVAASAPTGTNGANWVNLAPGGGSVSISGTDHSYSTALGTGTVVSNTARININSGGISINLSSFNKQKGTMEFWIYPTSFSGGNGLFINRSDSTANSTDWFWIGFWDAGNAGYFRIGSPSLGCCGQDNYLGNMGAIYPLNTWSQLVTTWDFSLGSAASYTRWWKNGELLRTQQISSDVTTSNVSSTGLLFNGHENATDTTFNGHCGIIRHYNYPISQAQIRQNFNTNRARYGI